MKTLARRGAALAVAVIAAAGTLAPSPAAADETTTTVAATTSLQGSHSNIDDRWSIGQVRNAPWPAESTSNGSAFSGAASLGGYAAWLVAFALPSRLTCKVVSAQVSIRPFDQFDNPPFPRPDPPFAQANVYISSGNGNPTAEAFRATDVDHKSVTPPDDSPLALDFTDAIAGLVRTGSGFIDVKVFSGGTTVWDAPWDQPATRPSLTTTCVSGPDDDRDGVANADDFCAKTVLPDKIGSLSKVKYAANSSGVFRSGAGVMPGISLDHTAGCSAIQIGKALGPVVELDVRLWGLSLDKLQKWAATH